MKTKTILTTILTTALTIGSLNYTTAQSLPDNIDISTNALGVVALPSTVPAIYVSNGFVKYTKIACPNGEAIHFIAQNNISDAMIVNARSILQFYLTDFSGSQYGADKTAVMNTMGTNDATLMLVNGSHIEGQEPTINAQPLYQNEMQVPGHAWYQTNNYDYRDASFEEILHMMHDMGIGVDGPNSIPNGALPAFQTEIRAAQDNADNNNFQIWPMSAVDDAGWYNELDAENSLSQEYLASLIDSYYGLWNGWTEDPTTGMWGEYIAHNRAEIETEDPMGYALVPQYFSPFINIDMIIDPSFNGTFSLTYSGTTDYTTKSRYMQHVYLTGTNASGLQGNAEYNRLKGNVSNNSFEGLKGNDRLDGQGGVNTAIFTGDFADYTITNNTNHAIVADGTADRDGVDTLWNMHFLQFSDQTSPIILETTAKIETKSDDLNGSLLYPNPSNHTINISTPLNNKGNINLEIRNLAGQLIQQKSFNSTITLDISDLTSGIYLVSLKSNNSSKHLKFVKKQ